MPRSLLYFYACVSTLCLGLYLWPLPAQAATITVTTTADTIGDDAVCSLREAIISANTNSAVGSCASGNGADTIRLDPALFSSGIFVLTRSGTEENAAQTGDLDVTGYLTIQATALTNAPATIVIDGNGSDRVFEIRSSAQVTITGVTIRNGQPEATGEGGGILVDPGARLTLANSQVISNSAVSGGGLQVAGRLTMDNSVVAGNQGGGITNGGGLVTLRHVDLLANQGGYGFAQTQGALTFTQGRIAANQSGGLYNAAGMATLTQVNLLDNRGSGAVNIGASLTRLTISQSQIFSNTATSGGGVYNEGVGASVDIADSRISGNQATSNGGGLFNSGLMALHNTTVDHNHARAGAGIHHFGGNLSLINDTISQNSASDNGGGLYNGSNAVLNAVTFAENRATGTGGNLFIDAASLTIENSIIAQAQSGNNCVKASGFLTSLGHNLESANQCQLTAAGDLVNTDPQLDALQVNDTRNGQAIATHALLPGSPAIDQGGATCPDRDQRGVPRPQGPACDIGAYEFAAQADLAIIASVTPLTITAGSRVTYTLTIHNDGPLTATALLLRDEAPAGATLMTATITGGVCTLAAPLTCVIAQLAPAQQVTGTLVLTAPLTTGLITNTATISATTVDLNPANNQASTVRTVTAPPDTTPPGPVANLVASAVTPQGATLQWDAASDNVGVAGYYLYAQSNGARLAPFRIGQSAGPSTAYTVTTLLAHTTYQLWVVAYDAAGNVGALALSTPVSITTLALPVSTVQIGIIPPLPTEHDPISITITGQHNSSCVPETGTHERNGQVITITSRLSTEPFCLPAEFSWNYTVAVGVLPAGRYTVTHSLGAISNQAVFTVTVNAGPTPPQFYVDGKSTPSAVLGQLFQYTVAATGQPTPTYSLVEAPTGMTIDATTGQLRWMPTAAATEEIAVTVRATNQLGSADYTFTVQIQTPAANAAQLFLPFVAK